MTMNAQETKAVALDLVFRAAEEQQLGVMRYVAQRATLSAEDFNQSLCSRPALIQKFNTAARRWLREEVGVKSRRIDSNLQHRARRVAESGDLEELVEILRELPANPNENFVISQIIKASSKTDRLDLLHCVRNEYGSILEAMTLHLDPPELRKQRRAIRPGRCCATLDNPRDDTKPLLMARSHLAADAAGACRLGSLRVAQFLLEQIGAPLQLHEVEAVYFAASSGGGLAMAQMLRSRLGLTVHHVRCHKFRLLRAALMSGKVAAARYFIQEFNLTSELQQICWVNTLSNAIYGRHTDALAYALQIPALAEDALCSFSRALSGPRLDNLPALVACALENGLQIKDFSNSAHEALGRAVKRDNTEVVQMWLSLGLLKQTDNRARLFFGAGPKVTVILEETLGLLGAQNH